MYQFLRRQESPDVSQSINVDILRSFLQKGRQLRRRCGQYKATEKYSRHELLFTKGFTSATKEIGRECAYLIPSADCLRHMCGLLLSIRPHCKNDCKNFIIFQTALKYATDSAGGNKDSICDLIRDASGSTVVCFNEFNEGMSLPPRVLSSGRIETEREHRDRLLVFAARYLSERLGLTIKLLLAHDNDSLGTAPGAGGLPVFTIQELLRQSISEASSEETGVLQTALGDCGDIWARVSVDNDLQILIQKDVYRPHVSIQDLQNAHRKGSVLRGKVIMERGNSDKMDVVLAGHKNLGPFSDMSTVRILGRDNINRAINGDVVYVKLHPKSMWVSLGETVESALDDWEEDAVDTLNPRDTMVKVDLQSEAFLIPTGEVLGIHSSPTVNRDIVAFVSMPRSTEGNPTTSDDATSVASYIGKEENILVVPCDRSLPRFRVTTRQRSWLQGKKIIIRMDGWKKDSVFPSAHIIRSLIGSSDFALEMEALLLEHSIYNRPFSVQALACLPAVPHSNSDCRTKVAVEVDCSNPDPKASRQPWVDSGWVVPDHAMLGRKDLRNTKTIFSVDPRGCQDIDDSMHAQWLRPGVLEVGVHIADVCFFVEQGSPLDIEAQRRGTTVYLTHCRIDMLPSLISSDIASLHGNKDRLAMTVMWELHVTRPDGYPADESDFDRPVTESTSSSWYDNFIISIPDDPCWCGRTVIKSKAAMTYEQADQLISSGNIYDQPDNVPVGQAGRPVCKTLFPRLIPDLRVLTLVSRALKKRRELSGSVNFSRGDEGGGGELRFDLQGGNGPTAVEASKHLEVHDTIAELMILSNSAVAKIISEALPVQALVRIHAPPPLHKLENVRDFCEQIGVNVFRSPNATELIKQIPKFHSLLLGDSNKGQTAVGRRDALELMTSVLIRAMSEAAYVSTGSLVGDMAVVSNTTSDAVKSEELVYKGKHELRKGHYGLGVLHYTHFTSPIRRYADVVVHRQLLFALQQPNVALRWETSRDAIINSSSEIGVISDLVSEGSAENEVNLDNFMDSLLEDVGDSLIVPTKPAQNSSYASALVVEAKSSSTDRLHSTIEKDSESFGASISMPPYTGSELFKIANELNILNRNSKWVQSACQKLFLTLYFKNKMQLFDAVIYGVKENGILVYVPCFDFKGSIMFCTKKGVVRLHKNLLKHLDKIEFSQCQELRGFIKSSFADDIIECPELMCELKRSRNHDSLRAVDREEDTKTSVLRIIRRRTAICAEQSILDLVPLQKIQVLMTTKSYSGGGSDIELILHSITHLKSSVKDDSSTFVKERSTINEIGASIAADCLSPTVSEFKITEIKPQRASPSLYEHIHVSIDHIASLIGVSSSFNKERYKKVLSDSKTVEYRIKGTGRICFDGDYKDESNFASEMFLSNGNDSSRKQAKSEASNAGFLTGKAAALDKMKLWGEEWAEEEDLPGTITREDEISDEGDLDMGQSGPIAYQIGGGRRISEPDRSSNHAANNFGRTVALASQRQHKLKVAKRNSKYN